MEEAEQLQNYFLELCQKCVLESENPNSLIFNSITLKESNFKKLSIVFYEWYSVDFESKNFGRNYDSNRDDLARIPINDKFHKEYSLKENIDEPLNVDFFKNLRNDNKNRIINLIEKMLIENA